MGRGLAAILSVTPREESEEFRQLPIELIVPNPHQPRQVFDENPLLALAESIRARGVLQPVLARPLAGGRFELIAGERRWRAAQLAELESIPAIIRHHDDAASLEVALIENMAREDLNPVEQARACAALVEELGLTREEVGLRVGRSRVAVSNLIRLLDLPDEAREAGGGAAAARKPRTRRRPALHPDQADAVERIADALGEALGADVDVRPSGRGYHAQLTFGSLEEALDLARRLRVRAAA